MPSAKVPTGQADSQELAPWALYVPAGQVAHAADWLAALKVPAAQGVQAAAPEEEKEPGGQAAHAKAEAAPGVAENVPAGQAFAWQSSRTPRGNSSPPHTGHRK